MYLVCVQLTEPLSCLCLAPTQVCQVSAQQPVQTELLMRYHQLQSRLATLKIENEEVRAHPPPPFLCSGVGVCSAEISLCSSCWGKPSTYELLVSLLFWLQMSFFPCLLQEHAVFYA